MGGRQRENPRRPRLFQRLGCLEKGASGRGHVVQQKARSSLDQGLRGDTERSLHVGPAPLRVETRLGWMVAHAHERLDDGNAPADGGLASEEECLVVPAPCAARGMERDGDQNVFASHASPEVGGLGQDRGHPRGEGRDALVLEGVDEPVERRLEPRAGEAAVRMPARLRQRLA